MHVLHLGPNPAASGQSLDPFLLAGGHFDLHRRGGCGAGELTLAVPFSNRDQFALGDWLSVETNSNERWYLGRVEERLASPPNLVTLRLEGMAIQLNEVHPGDFHRDSDRRPHRFSRTDLFPNDPDRLDETVDAVDRPEDLVRMLLDRYVADATQIVVDDSLIEDANPPPHLVSAKFNGEESVRSILKDLALRAENASWGVDEQGRFFFLQRRNDPLANYQLGVDVVEAEEQLDRSRLFNRILLTGGYIYETESSSAGPGPGFSRWRGNYRQPQSASEHGERRIRLWVPWIRTAADSRQFAEQFFYQYADPLAAWEFTALSTTLPRPWLGAVSLLNRDGSLLYQGMPESIRVELGGFVRLTFEVGPDDPRDLWPEPAHDERWPVARVGERDSSENPPSDDSSFTSSLVASSNSLSESHVSSEPDGNLSTTNPPSSSTDDNSSEASSSLEESTGSSTDVVTSTNLDSSSLPSSTLESSLDASSATSTQQTASSEDSSDASSASDSNSSPSDSNSSPSDASSITTASSLNDSSASDSTSGSAASTCGSSDASSSQSDSDSFGSSTNSDESSSHSHVTTASFGGTESSSFVPSSGFTTGASTFPVTSDVSTSDVFTSSTASML